MKFIKLFEEVSKKTIINVLSNQIKKCNDFLYLNKMHSIVNPRLDSLSRELEKIIKNQVFNYKKEKNPSDKLFSYLYGNEQYMLDIFKEKEVEKIRSSVPNIFDFYYHQLGIFDRITVHFNIKKYFYNEKEFIQNKANINSDNNETDENLITFDIYQLKDDYFLVIITFKNNNRISFTFDQMSELIPFLKTIFT